MTCITHEWREIDENTWAITTYLAYSRGDNGEEYFWHTVPYDGMLASNRIATDEGLRMIAKVYAELDAAVTVLGRGGKYWGKRREECARLMDFCTFLQRIPGHLLDRLPFIREAVDAEVAKWEAGVAADAETEAMKRRLGWTAD